MKTLKTYSSTVNNYYERRQLLLEDLCARLPYGVKVQYKDRIHDIDHISSIYEEIKLDIVDNYTISVLEVKPYLFPLSSITIEQEKELSKLGISYSEYALHDDIRGLGIMVDEAYIFFKFCYRHHIDFLGLIGMGLANDASNLNIY